MLCRNTINCDSKGSVNIFVDFGWVRLADLLAASLSVDSSKQTEFNGNNLKCPLYFSMWPNFVTSKSWADLTEVSSVCMAACKNLFWPLLADYVQVQNCSTFRILFKKTLLHLKAHLLLTRVKLLFFTIVVVTRVAGEGAPRVHDERTTIDSDPIELIPIKVIVMGIVACTSITSLAGVYVTGSIPFSCT